MRARRASKRLGGPFNKGTWAHPCKVNEFYKVNFNFLKTHTVRMRTCTRQSSNHFIGALAQCQSCKGRVGKYPARQTAPIVCSQDDMLISSMNSAWPPACTELTLSLRRGSSVAQQRQDFDNRSVATAASPSTPLPSPPSPPPPHIPAPNQPA